MYDFKMDRTVVSKSSFEEEPRIKELESKVKELEAQVAQLKLENEQLVSTN